MRTKNIKIKSQIKIKEENDRKNEEMTEKILSGRARLRHLTNFKTKNYIKCKGVYLETIEGRLRIAFIRCPKCKQHISIYKDEMKDDKGHTKNKKCLCGFSRTFEMIGWKEK